MNSMRRWLIYWMYFIAVGHFVGGVLFAWFANLDALGSYHDSVVGRFGDLSIQLHQLHVWWLSLFGATLQNLAIFMGIVIYVGNKARDAAVWRWVVIGLVIWVSQDIIISLQVNLWVHVWVDSIALLVMLPPLLCLWWIDKHNPQTSS